MSEGLDSGAHRLHSGAPWWLLHNALSEQSVPLRDPVDVAVIGAGVTGALIADAMSAAGARVALFDRRPPVTGSSAVSTGLLQYELDVPLHRLIDSIGEENAVRAYRLSWDAIDRVEQIARSLERDVGFERKPSLYIASRRRDRKELDQECEVRTRHGFETERWSGAEADERYGIPCHGALHTPQAAMIDPVAFSVGLLARALGRGAALLPRTTVSDLRRNGTGYVLVTDRGEVAASQVVFALGYEMPPKVLTDTVKLHSTFAIVTEPSEDLGRWNGRCLVWETARPYAYMRPVGSGRVICGGEDLPFKNPDARDALLAPRARRLETRLSTLLPESQLQTAFSWSGTFAETRDGLPLIGPSAELHGAFVALGYGGNGITFSVIAADMLCDLLQGRGGTTPFRLFDPAR